MDGNGRWARARHHNRNYGHVRGAQVAKKVTQFCVQKGIKYLTLFTFSTENWLRPQSEVNFLMNLLNRELNRGIDSLIENNIRLRSIGLIGSLPSSVRQGLGRAIESTRHCDGMELVLALNYSGQQELCNAFQKMAMQVDLGELRASEITKDLISQSLESSFLPHPDLIIRTGGELRVSNFFLWQAAYSEIYFCDKYWPDFSQEDLLSSLDKFARSERRYGRLENQSVPSTNPATVSTS